MNQNLQTMQATISKLQRGINSGFKSKDSDLEGINAPKCYF